MNYNVIAPVCTTGYGIAAYNIIKELSKKNRVTLYPVSRDIEPQFRNDEDIIQAIENQAEPDLEAPTIKLWHQDQLQEFVGHGEHIGFPIFELDTFSPVEKSSLKHCDRLFVCSKWAKSVIEDNLPDFDESKIHVIPLGVDSTVFNPNNNVSRDKTIFLNCGKWEIRKGHDVLVEAFCTAFSARDDVELWMMCDNIFIGDDNYKWRDKYLKSSLGDKIRIIPRQKTHKDVYNIMRQADCGVFPARAEGWNLELLEMMACGKHVITTNYSAHTEFCNNQNAYLIDPEDGLEPANDGVWFKGQGNWMKFYENTFSKLYHTMYDFHEKKQSGSLSPNVEGVFTANKYSWNNTIQEIENAVRQTERHT